MKVCRKLGILLLWLFVWEILDWSMKESFLVAGRMDTIQALFRIIDQSDFWLAVLYSMKRIIKGFLYAFSLGLGLGIVSFRFPILKELLAPAVTFIRSVPVASFIVLALLWVGSKELSVLISFFMVFPIVYEGVCSGLSLAEPKLLEMCQVFSVTTWCKACTVYWYGLFPALQTACKNAIGMAWKAGVAAEVIGVPTGSLGEKLYYAKLYLDTGELFAWTLIIMLCSLLTSIAIHWLLQMGNQLMYHFPGTGRTKEVQEAADMIFSHVWKGYGEVCVLKQMSFKISHGTVVAIMGESGIGKTTLLRLMAGLEKPDKGIVQRNNGSVSMVFQEPRLLEPLTPWQNCRMGTGIRWNQETNKSKPERICCQLEELLPKECQNQPVGQFSGGMKQRVAIARAMLSFSHMIVLDEPFTGLDEENRKKAIAFIKKYQMGRTILFTTHQRRDVLEMEANEVIELEK